MADLDHVSRELSLGRLKAVHLRPYFASALFRLIPVRTVEVQRLAVDQWWRLYYNQEFFETIDIPRIATLLLHEVQHLLRDHHHRCELHGFDYKIYNYGADCEINDDLEHARDLTIPEGLVFPRSYSLPEGQTAEYYTQALITESAKFNCSSAIECGSGAHGHSMPWDLGQPSEEKRGVGKEEAALIREVVARELREWNDRNPGVISAELLRWAEILCESKVPWQKKLHGSVRANLSRVAGMSDYTFARPNRRQALFPEIIVPALEGHTAVIAIIIDVSGSMSESELAQALSEVKAILRAAEGDQGVVVLSVDCAVKCVKKVFDSRQVELIGGGGTDLSVGIEQAQKLRPKPDFLVLITDGFTPWPETPPRGMKPITLLLGSGERPPWGEVIEVNLP